MYSVTCGGCEKEYIGGGARTLRVRFKEHTDSKHPNSLYHHRTHLPHRPYLADVKVLVREDSDFKRKVKEAIAIHKGQPALNRDRGHKILPILLQLV